MDYKGIKFNIAIRLAALLLTMFALAMLNYDNPFIPTIIFFIIIIAIQVLRNRLAGSANKKTSSIQVDR